MKKVILVIFCTTILMSGCSSNTADTVSNDVQQVNVSYDQMNNEGLVGDLYARKAHRLKYLIHKRKCLENTIAII